MPQHRVAITGMGIISALGADLAANWSSLSQGKAGISTIQLVDVSKFRFQNGAEVREYDPEQHFKANQIDFLDRFAQFALIAARQALADSGLKITPELAGKMAVITGSCVGGQTSQDAGFRESLSEKFAPGPPFVDSPHHGECRSKPYLHGVWDLRACVHDFHGLFFRKPRNRKRLLDGPQWPGGSGDYRRQ